MTEVFLTYPENNENSARFARVHIRASVPQNRTAPRDVAAFPAFFEIPLTMTRRRVSIRMKDVCVLMTQTLFGIVLAFGTAGILP